MLICKNKKATENQWLKVGVAGFEPTTSWSQTRRDTGLRYTPMGINFNFVVKLEREISN